MAFRITLSMPFRGCAGRWRDQERQGQARLSAFAVAPKEERRRVVKTAFHGANQ